MSCNTNYLRNSYPLQDFCYHPASFTTPQHQVRRCSCLAKSSHRWTSTHDDKSSPTPSHHKHFNTHHIIWELSSVLLLAVYMIATKRHGVARGKGDDHAILRVRRRGKGAFGKAYFGSRDVIAAEEEFLAGGVLKRIGRHGERPAREGHSALCIASADQWFHGVVCLVLSGPSTNIIFCTGGKSVRRIDWKSDAGAEPGQGEEAEFDESFWHRRLLVEK